MDTNERLIRAVQHATRKLASNGKFNELMKDVLAICVDAVGASGGTIYLHDPATCRLRFQHVLPEDVADRLPVPDIPDDYGMAGQAFQLRKTICKSFPDRPRDEWNDFERKTGVPISTMLASPLLMDDETPIGVVQLLNKLDGEFTEADCSVLDTVGAVSTMAYMNFRLSEESSRASTLLGMGKVSHDIGNLAASLYANLSFSDMAMHGLKEHVDASTQDEAVKMYVETLDPMFGDLKDSVDRIVGYSRLISDMSAGRELRPDMKVAPLAETIQTSAAYLETEGRANRVALRYDIQQDAPPTLHDELYIFRIVQNLVGNAIKAVKETIPEDWRTLIDEEDETSYFGEVVVRYYFDGKDHIIEVQDSGPGMTEDVAERILRGNARSQWDKGSGSGWGTKIVMELAATHNGLVTIDSEVGRGTTFRLAIPNSTQRAEVAATH